MNKKKSISKTNSNIVKVETVDEVSQIPPESDSDSQLQSLTDKPETTEQKGEPANPVEEKNPTPAAKATEAKSVSTAKPERWFPFLGLLNLLLIIGLVGVAFYYWQMQRKGEVETQALLTELQSELDKKTNLAQIQNQLTPLKSAIDHSTWRIDALQKQQQALQHSTAKLFELYGRDDSDWQLTEVIYLMRIAQHKLALENDFEGAALTLQVASDRIATSADPGLVPVRVLMSEEIANLKTWTRPDLVGMTLLLLQLSQQIQSLKAGYQPGGRVAIVSAKPTQSVPAEATQGTTIKDRVKLFFSTLVTVKHDSAALTTTQALIIDIEEIMESNLKLTRWAVLARDDFQYRQLMQENIRLFNQYYDLDDAANHDFYTQLLQLQQSPIKPGKPDIDGSLQLLKNIINQRQNSPDPTKIDPTKIDPTKIDKSKIDPFKTSQTTAQTVREVADNG